MAASRYFTQILQCTTVCRHLVDCCASLKVLYLAACLSLCHVLVRSQDDHSLNFTAQLQSLPRLKGFPDPVTLLCCACEHLLRNVDPDSRTSRPVYRKPVLPFLTFALIGFHSQLQPVSFIAEYKLRIEDSCISDRSRLFARGRWQ